MTQEVRTSTNRDKPLVFLVDDNKEWSDIASRWLASFEILILRSAEALFDALQTKLPDVVCLDLGLPGLSGDQALQRLRQRHATVPVVVCSASDDAAQIKNSLRAGAFDFVSKAGAKSQLATILHEAIDAYTSAQNAARQKIETSHQAFGDLVGISPSIRKVFAQISQIAPADITVLIRGESGTGKELVARAIHDRSPRSGGPFVAINCAAIADSLQDAELFGHEKGAFTGADKRRAGKFEAAHGGTLFLDEIAELSPSLQARLLRVLQERQFHRVGGNEAVHVDFRLVAATHRDLKEMSQQEQFRQDLYFRLAVLNLELPPLRERTEDIAPIAAVLLERLRDSWHRAVPSLSYEAANALKKYSWPGNVRELYNVLQRAAVLCRDENILPEHLPLDMLTERAPLTLVPPQQGAPAAHPSSPQHLMAWQSIDDILPMPEVERWAIETAIHLTGGNIAEAIRRLGIGKTTLYRKLKGYLSKVA